MIRLEVRDYCDNCLSFESDLESPTILHGAHKREFISDTVVRCQHRERCENIKQYLERELVKGYKDAE